MPVCNRVLIENIDVNIVELYSRHSPTSSSWSPCSSSSTPSLACRWPSALLATSVVTNMVILPLMIWYNKNKKEQRHWHPVSDKCCTKDTQLGSYPCGRCSETWLTTPTQSTTDTITLKPSWPVSRSSSGEWRQAPGLIAPQHVPISCRFLILFPKTLPHLSTRCNVVLCTDWWDTGPAARTSLVSTVE